MAVNNPFIRYKIYTTSTRRSDESTQSMAKVSVVCFMTPDQSDMQPFLEKVLSAARVDRENYQIVFINKDDHVLASDHQWLGEIRHFLLFGLDASSIGLQISQLLYQIDEFKGTKIIQLPALQDIESDKNEKQKLWQLLKKEFLNE